jgi:hypothetical protein
MILHSLIAVWGISDVQNVLFITHIENVHIINIKLITNKCRSNQDPFVGLTFFIESCFIRNAHIQVCYKVAVQLQQFVMSLYL